MAKRWLTKSRAVIVVIINIHKTKYEKLMDFPLTLVEIRV